MTIVPEDRPDDLVRLIHALADYEHLERPGSVWRRSLIRTMAPRIAYQSNDSGQYEIHVRSFLESSGRLPISTNSGAQPRWRRDGKERAY